MYLFSITKDKTIKPCVSGENVMLEMYETLVNIIDGSEHNRRISIDRYQQRKYS
jgi:hypothetical protein